MLQDFEDSLVMFKAIRVNGLYCLKGTTLSSNCVVNMVHSLDSVILGHNRLRHLSEKGVNCVSQKWYLRS